MRAIVLIFFIHFSTFCNGQSLEKLILKGSYSNSDSIQMTKAYLNANRAVSHMYNIMNTICNVQSGEGKNKKILREEQWKADPSVSTWLGQPNKIGMAHRKIRRIYSRFEKKFTLEVTKKNKGRCKGWISAWTIPFGRVRITLCEDFFIYRTHLQEKVLIHEVGHEIGMFSHRRIHGCRAAKRAAASLKNNDAKRNPENYAWLAMSYLGLECEFY